jgi:hypothetical protein
MSQKKQHTMLAVRVVKELKARQAYSCSWPLLGCACMAPNNKSMPLAAKIASCDGMKRKKLKYTKQERWL